MKANALPLLLVLTISACASSSSTRRSDSPESATGETPIRFVNCNSKGQSCFVSARFDDFEGCEDYKKWSGMLCDRTTPGKMVCREADDSFASAYCTK